MNSFKNLSINFVSTYLFWNCRIPVNYNPKTGYVSFCNSERKINKIKTRIIIKGSLVWYHILSVWQILKAIHRKTSDILLILDIICTIWYKTYTVTLMIPQNKQIMLVRFQIFIFYIIRNSGVSFQKSIFRFVKIIENIGYLLIKNIICTTWNMICTVTVISLL
jgi:hypothetical protein